MSTASKALGFVLCLWSCMIAAGAASAQDAKPGGGRLPAWDPATVESFTGTVVKEAEVGQRVEVSLIAVKVSDGVRNVVLGPKQSLDPALTSIAPSTPVDVTASRVKGQAGRTLYLASAVKLNGKEYRLRDAEGRLLGKDGRPLGRKQ